MERADQSLPFLGKYHLVIRGSDLPPDILTAAKAVGIKPFGGPNAVDYYVAVEIANKVPGSTDLIEAASSMMLPLFPVWPSFVSLPFSAVTMALGISVFDGSAFQR